MTGKRVLKMGVIISGLVLFLFALPGCSDALAGCEGWDGIPTIRMKLAGGGGGSSKALVGKSEKKEGEPSGEKEKEGCEKACPRCITLSISDVQKFHGEVCPGVALAYRACQIAFSNLYPGEIPPRKDQFVVSGVARACPADSVSFITGARYGKGSKGALNGNLAFDESIGTFSYIFASMSSGKAIRLKTKFEFPKEFEEARAKMATDPEAKARFSRMGECLSRRILTAPDKDVFEVSPAQGFSWKEYKNNYLK